jgi:hypothetical protein
MNAAAIASGMTLDEMQVLWKELAPEQVFRARPRERSWLSLGWSALLASARRGSFKEGAVTALSNLESLFDTSPLEKTISTVFRHRWEAISRCPTVVVFATTDLISKQPRYFYLSRAELGDERWQRVENFDVFSRALAASAAIPVIFPPVGHLVDGGVARNQPLGAAVHALEDGSPIYILMPNLESLPETMDLASLPSRVLETWLSAGLDHELGRLAIKNTARRGLEKPLIPVCTIRPGINLEEFGSGLLKFGSSVSAIIERGEKDAALALEKFDVSDPKTWEDQARPLY